MAPPASRRGILRAGAGLMLGAAAPVTVLRLGSTSGRAGPMVVGALAFAQALAESSQGRLRVEVHLAQQAGGELEAAQDVSHGALDLCFCSGAGYAGLVPALAIFDIPYLFRDAAHARLVMDGTLGRRLLAAMGGCDVVGLGWGDFGFRYLTTGTRPVRRPADLAGMKLRVPQSEVMLASFRALGAEPVALPISELYAALASGRVEAQENALGNILGSRYFRVQKYLCLTRHIFSAAMLMMSRRAWQALAPRDQDLVRAAAAHGVAAARAAADQAELDGTQQLRAQGMTVIEDVDRPAFAAALAGLQPQFEGQFGAADLAAIRAAS